MLVIFDMGGVCTSNAADNLLRICGILGITKEQFVEYSGWGKTDGSDLMELCGDGKIGQKQFWEEFGKRSGIKVTTDWWHWLFHPQKIEGTYRLIEELKKCGHRVICGTNTMESHYQNHIERGDYVPFDQTYTSHIMGVSKPDVNFWKIILTAENEKPENTVFIDDKEENCRAAESLGIKVVRFENPVQAREEVFRLINNTKIC